MKVLTLPRFGHGVENTTFLNPWTGKLETRGCGNTVCVNGGIIEKVYPSLKQLKKIRDDLTRHIEREERKMGGAF
jgi:hypothetical protein